MQAFTVAPGPAWRRRVGYVALCLGAGLALFWSTASWPETPDGLFHLHRVRALAEALSMGVLWPRWFPDFAFGYGYPVLNFYAPAFYYGPALFHLAGLDLLSATRLGLALWYGLSGLAMIALLRCWCRPAVALWGALLYLAFPYRLYDLFIRGALPEFAAFLWLPLIAGLTCRLLRATEGEHSLFRRPVFLWLSLAWAGLFLTHNLTALMAVMMAGLLFPVLAAARLWSSAGEGSWARFWRVGMALGGPVIMGVALAGVQLLPAVLEVPWVSLGSSPPDAGFVRHFAGWRELWAGLWRYPYPDAAAATVPAPSYLLPTLILALGVLGMGASVPGRGALATALGIAGLSLFLTTGASAPLWMLGSAVLEKLQFPWRWQTLLAPAFAWCAALLLEAGWRLTPGLRRGGGLLAAAVVGVYGVWYALAGLSPQPAPYTPALLTREQMWQFDADHGQVGATWTAEFLPRWVQEARWAVGRAPTVPQEEQLQVDPVSWRAEPLQQPYLGGSWLVTAAQDFTLRFHQFFYPAWQVRLDGRPVEVQPDGPLALLAVDVPAGNHRLDLRWTPTPAVLLGLACSSLGGLVVALLAGRRRPLELVFGLAFVLLLVGDGLGWFARAVHPVAVGVNYGPVRLEGAVIGAAGPGDLLSVRLFWSVQEGGQPLTTFVHLVDAGGEMVAQRDEPLAGLYTPAERWLPGQVLVYEHQVPVPADLAPGTYTVYVGLYPPGQPEAPLQPVGHPTPRLAIGQVEVRP
ncbi:hypothetical protein FKZ61_010410 [Litorilinea aerophila]|uniref:Membrane protein 6-pyruvoyl-tetrahydropterin synthase-related domain-containing protein n=1 Tax=Litorilinea aerophila TaxID=1204385 RepID=A0A540VGD6_9CHLR|nr:hypothetical protein [Litorilinea aerophila]MCC9076520.1 hypothetical protein [Litorilinea aerophila]